MYRESKQKKLSFPVVQQSSETTEEPSQENNEGQRKYLS